MFNPDMTPLLTIPNSDGPTALITRRAWLWRVLSRDFWTQFCSTEAGAGNKRRNKRPRRDQPNKLIWVGSYRNTIPLFSWFSKS
jgi:hypothetical protein